MWENFCTKDLNYSQGISVEKDYVVSMTELVDYGYIIVCIYRLHDGKFWIFLKTIELIIQKYSLEIKILYYVVTGT